MQRSNMKFDRPPSIQRSDMEVCRALRLITNCLGGYPQAVQCNFECMKAFSKRAPVPELAQGGGYPAQSPQRDEPERYLFLVPYLQQTRRPQMQGTQALGNFCGSSFQRLSTICSRLAGLYCRQADGLAGMQMQLLRGTGTCVGVINF